jgi:hypothetical protein
MGIPVAETFPIICLLWTLARMVVM